MQNKFQNKTSPFVIGNDTTKKIMWSVSICLLPALIGGVVFFGPFALLIVCLCISVCMISELIYNIIFKQKISVLDGSAFLTGLLLGMMMPPYLPLYIPIIASAFAILIIKIPFGGLGKNWLNPAIAARCFVSFIWAKEMSHFQKPFYYLKDNPVDVNAISQATVYTISGATPLELLVNHKDKIIKAGLKTPIDAFNHFEKGWDYLDLFTGNVSGSIGETSALLLILGAVYLFYKKIIRFDLTFSFFISAFLFAWVFGGLQFNRGFFTGDPIFHILSGAMVIGILFIATDMVTHPMTSKGRIVFGIGCGVITMVFRIFTFFPEGVMFAILIMNLLTPVINRIFVVYPLGYVKEKIRE